MMTTTLALVILFATALLVLSNLRVVVNDTYRTLTLCAVQARTSGQLIPRAAFVALWLLIFTICYV